MAFIINIMNRPLSAAAIATVTVVVPELPEHFQQPKVPVTNVRPSLASVVHSQAAMQDFSIGSSLLSCSVKTLKREMLDSRFWSLSLTVESSLEGRNRHTEFAKAKPSVSEKEFVPVVSNPESECMYRWHLPKSGVSRGVSEGDKNYKAKSKMVVVLLGWLGAKQRHLKKYADWYTARGFHVVTFTFPMSDVMTYKAGGKAEKDVELLAEHLADCVSEEKGKNLVFHTFSNTGWLTYGVLLEKFQQHNQSVLGNIKGCIVDSAPVDSPDPQVWASGFSAAFLKKHSIATKGITMTSKSAEDLKPAFTETALLVLLEKFFEVVLNLPSINKRLVHILDLLTLKQPKCPQLYIYSSADRVIPAKSVESFVEKQQKAGHEVSACDFLSSPHVDHYRSQPEHYTSVLTNFLEDRVLTCCDDSS